MKTARASFVRLSATFGQASGRHTVAVKGARVCADDLVGLDEDDGEESWERTDLCGLDFLVDWGGHCAEDVS